MTPKICYLYLVHAIGKFMDSDLSDGIMQELNGTNVQSLIKGCPLIEERESLREKKLYLQSALDTINKHLDD